MTQRQTSVLQSWVEKLPMMQQTVLLTAIRGPDNTPKYTATKKLLRFYRRCVLLSALDCKEINNPYDDNGGSFTGPSIEKPVNGDWHTVMHDEVVSGYLREIDAVPHHFQMHFLHAAEIVGYKHRLYPIRHFWLSVYVRLVDDMHLHMETETELDERLGDSREGWLARADPATRE